MTGQVESIRAWVLSVTEDQRLQMLLVGVALGACLERATGGGAAVAISAALRVERGAKPILRAALAA